MNLSDSQTHTNAPGAKSAVAAAVAKAVTAIQNSLLSPFSSMRSSSRYEARPTRQAPDHGPATEPALIIHFPQESGLKPCPFCGEPGVIRFGTTRRPDLPFVPPLVVYAGCSMCSASCGSSTDVMEAADNWNRRAAQLSAPPPTR
jgi:hypothetical protein